MTKTSTRLGCCRRAQALKPLEGTMKLTEKKLDEIIEAGCEFATEYSVPVIVFDAKTREFQTATGVLIETKLGVILATAGHVIEDFSGRGIDGRLQIGRTGFVIKDVDAQRIKIDKKVDFGAISLNPEEVIMTGAKILTSGHISTKDVRQLDLVAYVGFPGCYKERVTEKLVNLKRFTLVGAVTTVEPDQFSLRISETTYNNEDNMDDDFHPGGISGAPVFSLFDFWDSHKREPQLVGFIQEGMAWTALEQKHYAVHSHILAKWFD